MSEAIDDLKDLTDELATSFGEFKSQYAARFADQVKRMDELEKRMNRPGASNGESDLGVSAETKAAVEKALRTALLTGDVRELKAMSVGVDSAGGYTVTPMLAPAIRNRIRELSPLMQYATVVPLSGADAYEQPHETTEVDAVWVGETASRPETDSPGLGLMRVPLHEIYAAPALTQTLIDTSRFDVSNWLIGRLGEKFARVEGAAFATGNGVGKPRGFCDYSTAATGDSARAWGSFEYVASGASGAFASSDPADPLIDLQSKLATGYRQNARWFMSRSVAAAVRKMKTTGGDYVWQPSIAPGVPPTLLGHEVVLVEDMPTLASGSLSIAFGDMAAAYTIVEMPGLKILPDPYTNKPYVIVYTYRRVGGGAVDFDALKFLKFSAS